MDTAPLGQRPAAGREERRGAPWPSFDADKPVSEDRRGFPWKASVGYVVS